MEHEKQLEALKDIRNMMERSSRFVSLSGLSGVFVGLFALAGAAAAYLYIDGRNAGEAYYELADSDRSFYSFFMMDALLVLLLSVSVSSIMTWRKAKKDGQEIWNGTARRLFINMMIPLLSGGIFCLVLVYHRLPQLIAPCMLLFYGMALLNAAKYTLDDIRYLGLAEIGLGLLASVFIGHGLLFWAIGFGLLHMIYGIRMYFKYEAGKESHS